MTEWCNNKNANAELEEEGGGGIFAETKLGRA
jgi:hypothetical protein